MNTSSWPSLSKSPVAAPQGQSVSRLAATAVSVNFPWPRLRYSALPKSSASKSSPCRANIARWTEMRPGASQAGAVGDVGDGPIAVVVIKNVGFLGTGQQTAEVGLALVGPCRGVEDVGGPMRRVGEKQIEIAVVVVIEKHRGLRMADVAQPGFRRDVFEGAVPPVVEQRVPAPGAGYEQVGPTVVVVVGERGPDGDPIAQRDPRLRGDVDERAVALVAVQGVRPVLVEKVDVLVAIVVVIAHRQARAVIVQVDAEPLALFLRQVMHPKRDPGLPGAVLKTRSSPGSLCLVARTPDKQDRTRDRPRHDDRDHERPRRHRRCDLVRHVWDSPEKKRSGRTQR